MHISLLTAAPSQPSLIYRLIGLITSAGTAGLGRLDIRVHTMLLAYRADKAFDHTSEGTAVGTGRRIRPAFVPVEARVSQRHVRLVREVARAGSKGPQAAWPLQLVEGVR